MSKRKVVGGLYCAIDFLGEDFNVIYQIEYITLIEVFEWYLKKHPLEDDNSDIIEMYSALLKYKDTNKSIYLARDGKDVLLKEILEEYLDEHEQTDNQA